MASCETVYQIPGPRGLPGSSGGNGTNGINAFSTTTSPFVMPAPSEAVAVLVDDNRWMSPTSNGVAGQVVHVQGAGYFLVNGKTGTDTIELLALDLANNAAEGVSIPASVRIAPSGYPGNTGESGTGTASASAGYWVREADPTLTNPSVMSGLGTGLLKLAANGVPAIAVPDTDYVTNGNAVIAADIGQPGGVQQFDTFLESIAQLGTGADKMIYSTGINVAAEAAITAVGRAIIAAATQLAARQALQIGANPVQGYRVNALTNANVTLVFGTDEEHQRFTGTLSGGVQLILSAVAPEGTWFWLHLAGVVTTASFTLDIRDSVAGSLVLYNTSATVSGLIRAYFDGSQWRLANLEAVAIV